MNIVTYDDLDPLQALNLSLLALDFPFTPEHAAHIRHTDPRPFPCLAVYAVEDGAVIGQVGVFRLPMISIDGREDVGRRNEPLVWDWDGPVPDLLARCDLRSAVIC